MEKATIAPESPDAACEQQTVMSLIERVIELSPPHEPEHQRREIMFDKWCRRDAAEVLHAKRIRGHTLIDDNPTSG